MEANELCVDDWVNVVTYDSRIEPFMAQVQVVSKMTAHGFYPEDTKASYEDEHYGWAVGLDKISPIEITPELLEKNGFYTTDGGMYYYLDCGDDFHSLEYYKFEGRLRQWSEGVDEWCNHAVTKDLTFQCQCRYVHELQHAIRMCGIHKEIII